MAFFYQLAECAHYIFHTYMTAMPVLPSSVHHCCSLPNVTSRAYRFPTRKPYAFHSVLDCSRNEVQPSKCRMYFQHTH